MATALIVQARMGSSRLPGKVLLPIDGRPMLSFLLERLRHVREADAVIVATSIAAADDAIEALCDAEEVQCTRGAEQDVLSRYAQAAERYAASAVVRVTADCPLIDPDLIDMAIGVFRHSAEKPDFVSNMLEPTWPYGMAVEVFSRENLSQANLEATDPEEREHVTPFFIRHPARFRLKSLTMHPDLSRHRWTVDTREDFELVSKILTSLYPRKPDFRLQDVLALLNENLAWQDINRHVPQKTIARGRKES